MAFSQIIFKIIDIKKGFQLISAASETCSQTEKKKKRKI